MANYAPRHFSARNKKLTFKTLYHGINSITRANETALIERIKCGYIKAKRLLYKLQVLSARDVNAPQAIQQGELSVSVNKNTASERFITPEDN